MTTPLKTPPQSIEAEQSVLGAIFLDQTAMDRVGDVLTEADFCSDVHRRIYRAMEVLTADGQPIDVMTVETWLKNAGDLERVGGITYLGELVTNVPGSTNVRYYAQVVRDHRLARDLLAAAGDLHDIALSAEPIATRMDRAQALVLGLTETAVSRDAKSITEAMVTAIEALEARYNASGDLPGIPTGLADLDKRLGGLRPGNLVLVAGRPAMGKSVLGEQIAVHCARQGKAAVVFTLEMSADEYAERAIVAAGKVDSHKMRVGRDLTDDDWSRVSSGLGLLTDMPLFIDDTADATVSRIRAKARRLKRAKGLDLIVVDYLQLMSGNGDSRREEVDDISRGLKLLAKELQVPIIALSQLSRKCEERTNKRPMMSDLRESGSLEQDADVILFLYRDEEYNQDSPDKGVIEIHIAKQRMGPTGTVYATWLGEHYLIADRAEPFTPRALQGPGRRKSLMAEAGL